MVDLSPGDLILAIDGVSTSNMMHCEAQTRMKQATRQLSLTIQRSEVMNHFCLLERNKSVEQLSLFVAGQKSDCGHLESEKKTECIRLK